MKIDLFWHRHRSGHGNFGDELSPWVVRRLAPNAIIRWVDPLRGERPLARRAFSWVRAMGVRSQPNGVDLRHAQWHALTRGPSLLAIGSILRRACRSNTTIWGSGIISQQDQIGEGRFLAVRGPRTRDHLHTVGLQAPEAMGDPALLAPLFFGGEQNSGAEVVLIPHHVHYEAFLAATPPGIRVLDLTAPLESTLGAIAGAQVTLSTSLHGLIVSHAFGVPSLWISAREVKDIQLFGDGVKFGDYFGSVGLAIESPIDVGYLAEASARSLRRTVENQHGATLPSRTLITERQRDLLVTAPFPGAGDFLKS